MLASSRRRFSLIAALLVFLLPTAALAQRIIVNVIPVVSGAPLRMDTLAYTNAAGVYHVQVAHAGRTTVLRCVKR